jgi:putative transposase
MAHEFERYLKKSDPFLLEKHFVNKSDRSFQFWEREPMVKECWTKKFFRQKLNYIHFNPCQPHWNLATSPEENINGHQQASMKRELKILIV